MLTLMDFPFRAVDDQASIHVLSAPYLFWPARADDGEDVKVYVRLSVLEEALGIVGVRMGSERHSPREPAKAPPSH